MKQAIINAELVDFDYEITEINQGVINFTKVFKQETKMKTQVLEYIDALAFGDEEVKEQAHDFLYEFVHDLEI